MFEISEKRYGLEGFAKTLGHLDLNLSWKGVQ